ncbi:MBL fold metallo-hydrolase [Bradyrhizobium sp. C-145]|uniref:MBL fold metallo-hydrolase n=1 Tax=Bradyrhizobium sp. C-145 TaxID=574727 RepID=UPI00201B66B3|nr:MBL fold metallo-hydrolase [Bradyrhizobium sp. C-145]UQR61456.1 MBL fold metallo-hydrolase [Bradyrhizobium sp. C-145]
MNYVMCSHLHGDHYGWNTRLKDGKWVPTFPNARYLISRGEYEFWRNDIESGTAHPMRKQPWTESMLPIIEHGLATFVEGTYGFEKEMPDEVRYMPLHGHTKHHCGLYIRHGPKDAIFPGDGIEHAIQLARPDIVGAMTPRPQPR